MIVGFTGTQEGMTTLQKGSARGFLSLISGELHHGDCIGADAEMHDIAEALGWDTIIHPPANEAKRAFKSGTRILRPLPYLVRNKHIVEASSIMIATPKEFEEQLRSGTWSTVRYARRRSTAVFIIYPDGEIK